MEFNSKALWEERERLSNEQHALMDEGKADEARVIEGQLKELDITLDYVLKQEDALRNAPKPEPQPMDAVTRLLGPRDEFKGLEIGFKNAVTYVTPPTEVELGIPAKQPAVLANFAGTLADVPADGSVSYKQRGTQTGAPDTWAGVTDGTSAIKEAVIYTWTDAVANQETIAGYVPVSKKSLRDYDELENVIFNDLLIDVDDKVDAKLVAGSNSTGIVGITNTTGIQTYTTASAGAYFDAIRKMRTLVMENARRVPTHVCLSPEIKEAIDLYKTSEGLYQSLGTDVYWGMQVVEDINCPGILVYDSYAATVRTIGQTTVEVGYANAQFIQNELSVLAETTKALQVRYPDAFCYAAKTDLDATA